MTAEEKKRLDTWAAEWKLTGLRVARETTWGNMCVGITMTRWDLAIKETPTSGGWAVWNPTGYEPGDESNDMFFETLDEALDNASERLRRML